MLVRWFWKRYVRSRLPALMIGFLLMALEGGALGALSYLVRPLFDNVFIAGNRQAVLVVALIVFAVFIARAIAGFTQRMLMALVARKVSADIQCDLVAHMLTLDSRFYQENSPGILMERVLGDPGAAAGVISTTFSAFGRDLVALVSLLGVALYIDWLWTLIAIAGAPLLVLPILLLQRLVRNMSRATLNASARVTNRLSELFHGINTVKLNTIEEHESRRFANAVSRLVDYTLRAAAANAGIPALMDVIAAIGFLGVLTYGGYQIIDGSKTVGEFMSFFTAISLVFEPLRRLGAIAGAWQAALVSLERIYDIFQMRPAITSPARPAQLGIPIGQADIRLENVSFSYGSQPVIENASFTAPAGRTTALVGASGAGKSTVFGLLTRLIDPDDGRILLGDTDIRNLDLRTLRGLFSVVTQDAQMFDETIRDNILLGSEADEAALARALDAAHVTDFLSSQPEGLDSRAGPRGSALSGGQRQRVAIARALLRDTPILLLDEATSALDARSEAIVQSALERLSEGRTTLVIAHRLSTVRNADKIVVMDQGRVVDEGTHDTLIAREGIYRNLYRLQFSPKREERENGAAPGANRAD